MPHYGTDYDRWGVGALRGALQGLFSRPTPSAAQTISTPASPTSQRIWPHFSQYSMERWSWPNFEPWEIACRHCGRLVVDVDFLDRLQCLRDIMGPLVLSNVCRCALHNAREGGRPASEHLRGRAGDIQLLGYPKRRLRIAAGNVGFTGFGYYNGFLHVDTGRPRWWGNKEGWV